MQIVYNKIECTRSLLSEFVDGRGEEGGEGVGKGNKTIHFECFTFGKSTYFHKYWCTARMDKKTITKTVISAIMVKLFCQN